MNDTNPFLLTVEQYLTMFQMTDELVVDFYEVNDWDEVTSLTFTYGERI